MKRIYMLVGLVLTALLVLGCTVPKENELLGYWLSESGISLNFTNDKVYMNEYGREVIEADKYSYEVNEGYITFTLDSSLNSVPYSITYNYQVEDDVLTLYNEEYSTSYYGALYMQEEIMVGLHTMNRD